MLNHITKAGYFNEVTYNLTNKVRAINPFNVTCKCMFMWYLVLLFIYQINSVLNSRFLSLSVMHIFRRVWKGAGMGTFSQLFCNLHIVQLPMQRCQKKTFV